MLAATLAVVLVGTAVWQAYEPGARSSSLTSDAAMAAAAEVEGSLRHWSERVAADPADFVARERLAATLLRRFAQEGDPSYLLPALEAASAAVELSRQPGSGAYTVLSAAQAAVHDFDGALESAQLAAELRPSSATVWLALSDAYAAQRRSVEATEALQPALRMQPGLTTYARRAALSLRLGDLEAARADWELAFLDLDGQRPEDLAWALTLRAEFEGASGDADPHRTLDEALDWYPGYHGARFERVHVAVDRGDLATAQAQLEQLIVEMPTLDVGRLLVWVTTARGDAAAASAARLELEGIEARYAEAGIAVTTPLVGVR